MNCIIKPMNIYSKPIKDMRRSFLALIIFFACSPLSNDSDHINSEPFGSKAEIGGPKRKRIITPIISRPKPNCVNNVFILFSYNAAVEQCPKGNLSRTPGSPRSGAEGRTRSSLLNCRIPPGAKRRGEPVIK